MRKNLVLLHFHSTEILFFEEKNSELVTIQDAKIQKSNKQTQGKAYKLLKLDLVVNFEKNN